jgi:tripartite-type tricarboxylate transporter receptor subunit TctC
MADAGLKATSLDAAAFGALIRKEREEMASVVKAAGIQPE